MHVCLPIPSYEGAFKKIVQCLNKNQRRERRGLVGIFDIKKLDINHKNAPK